MTTFNQELTFDQATELFKYVGATQYPSTDHNKKMMAKVIDCHLKSLRK